MTSPVTGGDAGDAFLTVDDLTVRFPTEDGLVTAVSNLSYSVELGKTLGIVGESGSGKSVSTLAVLGLHDRRSSRITGSIRVGGTEVVGLSEERLRDLRGNQVAMIFQDALAALHPFYKVGSQLSEAYLVHHPSASKRDARRNLALRPDLSDAAIDYRINRMNVALPDALHGPPPDELIASMPINAKDRHVLALAVQVEADSLVTFDLGDFPATTCEPYGIEPLHLTRSSTPSLPTSLNAWRRPSLRWQRGDGVPDDTDHPPRPVGADNPEVRHSMPTARVGVRPILARREPRWSSSALDRSTTCS